MHPTQFGPYTISTPLGRGGMGAVYEAVHGGTGEAVAVKTLAAHLGDDASLRRRFAAEIETLKSLRHPCIVRLLAFGEHDGQPYFAMELVRGRSLEQLLRTGRRFTWRETIDTAIDIARALKSAHDHGVVHRDLKPANLLFPDEPAADAAVKLADFGIARLFGSATHTMAGMIVGTAEYMAPEQAAGQPADHRVDLYALGLVMFAMLTGRPPFQGGQVTDVLEKQRSEAAPRVSSKVAGVPPELDELIDRLLAKDPARRPGTALAVGRLLSAIARITPAPGAGPVGLESGRTAAVDLLAATRDFSEHDTAAPRQAVIPSDAAGPLVPADAQTMPLPTKADGSLAQRVTQPASAGSESAAARVNRFTTLAELHDTMAAEAASRHRRDAILQGIAAVAILAAVAAAAVVLLRPPTAEALHARIMAIATDPDADLRDARPLIERFLAAHAADPRAEAIRELDRTLDLDALERRARRRSESRSMSPLEREYRAAMAREDESPQACVAALQAILALHAVDEPDPAAGDAPPADASPAEEPGLWLALVQRQLEKLEVRAAGEREQDVALAEASLLEAADLAAAAAATDDAVEQQRLLERRRGLLAGLVEIYAARPHVADAVGRARTLLEAAETP
jgi:serine/threonine-protein kinase